VVLFKKLQDCRQLSANLGQWIARKQLSLLHLYGPLALSHLRLTQQILPRPFNGVLLPVEQVFDLEQELHFFAAIHAVSGTGLLRPDRRKFRLPIPQHVRFHTDQIAHLAYAKVEFIGDLRYVGALIGIVHLAQDIVDDTAVHVGEAEIADAVAIGTNPAADKDPSFCLSASIGVYRRPLTWFYS
jgi:hypothetical protein